MASSFTQLTRILLLAPLVVAAGCGKKPADQSDATPAPKEKPKDDRPPPKGTGRSDPPGPPDKQLGTGQPVPKVAAGKPIEVHFTGTDFDDVRAGDGVSFRATCAGKEEDRIILIDALRHTGTRPPITAPELHAAYVKSAAAADKRFQHKGVTVRGVAVSDADKLRGRLYISPTEEPKAIKPDGKPDLTKAKPDHTLTAQEFGKEFDAPAGTVNMTAREKFQGSSSSV
jgi:hypothetical protein